MIYIGIGSNLGNRLHNIQQAVFLLEERYFRSLKTSIVLETPAILPPNAPVAWNKPYLNMVVCGESTLSLEQLLTGLKAIEQEMGRESVHPKWGPRIIDLDILFKDNHASRTPRLTIPHPELLNRPFLLHLMALLSPEGRYQALQESPYNNKTFGEIAYLTRNMNTCYDQSLVLNPKLVGVVNITPDSFSDGGQNFAPRKAIERAKQLVLEGATVVELGAQSTRPEALILDHDIEYLRLQPVLEGLSEDIKRKEIILSIDTFSARIILKILEDYPISWINDVKGGLDDSLLRTVSERGLKIVVMHSLSIPPRKDLCLDFEYAPIDSINQWARHTIDRLEKCGFSKDNIILDPGIGFGKSSYQNISLLKNMHHLKELGCKVMVGHSRKSYIASFCHSEVNERDLETIAVSRALADQSVDYLRIHNVKDHQRFFVAQHLAQCHHKN